jgi:hypothetical protein
LETLSAPALAPSARAQSIAASGVAARSVLLAIVALLGVQNLLLLLFLGQSWGMVAASGLVLTALLMALRHVLSAQGVLGVRIDHRLVATCFVIALLVYMLGGEGRFFYANTDWQVRGPVLHDLVRYPWPFAYAEPSGGMVLRAPMGMYLAPAAVAKLTGEGSVDVLLLLQNALLLTGVLALGSTLFESGRARGIALFVFLGFSGMDCVGQYLVGHRLDVHLEQWTALQYSAVITQAFWVPQHSVAGWIGALLYLLWREKRIPLVAFAATCPLLALLSPLAMMGLVPFMAHAGIETLLRRQLRVADIVLPALALTIALPSLLYMSAGTGVVGHGIAQPTLLAYAVSIVLEVGLPLTALFLHGGVHRYGKVTSLIVLAMLLLAPFGHVGEAVDFVMRASIPALAILTLLIAQLLIEQPVTERQRIAVGLAMVAFMIGLATPATEIIRALRFPASPAIGCSYAQVVPGGATTYVAPVDSFPSLVRPRTPMLIGVPTRTNCWNGPWPAGELTGLFDPIHAATAKVYVRGQTEDGNNPTDKP